MWRQIVQRQPNTLIDAGEVLRVIGWRGEKGGTAKLAQEALPPVRRVHIRDFLRTTARTDRSCLIGGISIDAGGPLRIGGARRTLEVVGVYGSRPARDAEHEAGAANRSHYHSEPIQRPRFGPNTVHFSLHRGSRSWLPVFGKPASWRACPCRIDVTMAAYPVCS